MLLPNSGAAQIDLLRLFGASARDQQAIIALSPPLLIQISDCPSDNVFDIAHSNRDEKISLEKFGLSETSIHPLFARK